ncbi:MAG TPA: glycosyltransferase family 4 protein [Flavisolibacter sp.]|nr:glycosyltransferase family 4 protein [Flavisolibacter sp.]
MPSFFFLSLMNGAAWGGSEELWYRTALHAAKKGHTVACAFYHWPEKEEKITTLKEAGCQVYLLPNKGRRKANLAQKLRYKISKWKVGQTISSLPFQQYDLVVVNLGGFEIYTSTWKNVYRHLPTYALLFHNYNEDAVFKPTKATRLRQWINSAAINLFAAKRIQESLEEKLAIEIVHGDILLNPITIASAQTQTSYPAMQEPFIFMMLAELVVSRKAQDNLIKALSSAKWRGRNWQLRLYGKGQDHHLLQSLVSSLNLQEKVELKGHTSQVKVALQEAHLVLQITHRDAMPLAVVEAMAMARPLVVSRVGDMPRWVEEGHNGWLAKDATVEGIDAALEKAWQNKERWPQAGAASFAIFQEKFPASAEERLLKQLQQAIPTKR